MKAYLVSSSRVQTMLEMFDLGFRAGRVEGSNAGSVARFFKVRLGFQLEFNPGHRSKSFELRLRYVCYGGGA